MSTVSYTSVAEEQENSSGGAVSTRGGTPKGKGRGWKNLFLREVQRVSVASQTDQATQGCCADR